MLVDLGGRPLLQVMVERLLRAQTISGVCLATTTNPDDDPLEALLDFSGPTTAPEDPVLQRLFPTAYTEDEEAAGEFRRFTEGTLRDSKSAAAESIIDALEEAGLPKEPTEVDHEMVIDVELDEPEALTWMRSFTDLRLALGTRLEVEEGEVLYALGAVRNGTGKVELRTRVTRMRRSLCPCRPTARRRRGWRERLLAFGDRGGNRQGLTRDRAMLLTAGRSGILRVACVEP